MQKLDTRAIQRQFFPILLQGQIVDPRAFQRNRSMETGGINADTGRFCQRRIAAQNGSIRGLIKTRGTEIGARPADGG